MNTALKNKVATFKARAATFQEQLENLKAREQKVPKAWQGKYRQLMTRGEAIKEEAKAAAASIDSGYRLARGPLQMDDEQINGLGLLPLIPLAFISGSSAVMAYFANDAYTFNSKVDELERLQELGYDKEQAATMLDKPAGAKGLLQTIWRSPPLRYGALAAIGFVGYKKLIAKG